MMKKLTLFLIMLISTAVFAQDLPDYEPELTGDEPPASEVISQTEPEPPADESSSAEAAPQAKTELVETEFTIEEPHPAESVKQAEAIPAISEPAAVIEVTIPAVQGKPTIAIYMAGEEPQGVRGVHNILGGELARTISESDRYLAVDRTEAVRKQLASEHIFQRSGAVDEEQVKSLGRQLGAQFMCISNINPVAKRSYYLDIRLVDVETAQIIRTATTTSSLKDANEMTRAARSIAYELIETEKAKEQRARKKKVSLFTGIGLELIGAGAIAYGLIENNNVKDYVEKGEFPDADRSVEKRDAAYIAGAALIAGGLTIHIFF